MGTHNKRDLKFLEIPISQCATRGVESQNPVEGAELNCAPAANLPLMCARRITLQKKNPTNSIKFGKTPRSTVLMKNKLSPDASQNLLHLLLHLRSHTDTMPQCRSKLDPPEPQTKLCLEGHGDLLSRLIMGIIGVILWLTGVIKLLTY